LRAKAEDRRKRMIVLLLLASGNTLDRAASQAKAGGAERDRTDDLKLAKLALSQLSYSPRKVGDDPSFTAG
jgi:hypothetical protein